MIYLIDKQNIDNIADAIKNTRENLPLSFNFDDFPDLIRSIPKPNDAIVTIVLLPFGDYHNGYMSYSIDYKYNNINGTIKTLDYPSGPALDAITVENVTKDLVIPIGTKLQLSLGGAIIEDYSDEIEDVTPGDNPFTTERDFLVTGNGTITLTYTI